MLLYTRELKKLKPVALEKLWAVSWRKIYFLTLLAL